MTLLNRIRAWTEAPPDRPPATATPFTAPRIQEIGRSKPNVEGERLLGAIVLHYCQGEARFTPQFLEGLPDVKLEAHTEADGTLVVKARR